MGWMSWYFLFFFYLFWFAAGWLSFLLFFLASTRVHTGASVTNLLRYLLSHRISETTVTLWGGSGECPKKGILNFLDKGWSAMYTAIICEHATNCANEKCYYKTVRYGKPAHGSMCSFMKRNINIVRFSTPTGKINPNTEFKRKKHGL